MLPEESNNSETTPTDTDDSQNNGYTLEDLIAKGFTEDRFRIDRKKLEDMLRAQSSNVGCFSESAEEFFQRVMTTTTTHVSWPSKLKIGAKSKKDPHVKIVGKPEHVQIAKEMILQVLDTKKNRVTLKMDVSHSDHSYIIGKGGFKIQQVMEETGCHIHFPDSNRNNNAEKSNQVSIAGEAEGVGLARCKIRDLLPIVYMFELPNGFTALPGDENGPVLQQIQQTYSFNVTFKPMTTGRLLIVIRGCHKFLQRLRQGLIVLMECLTSSKTVPVMGTMKTEIAYQNHSYVMGVNNCNLQAIMNKTGAMITFPDPSAPLSYTLAVPSGVASLLESAGQTGVNDSAPGPQVLLTKTSVLIQGSFDSVCAAWDELLNSLPLLLMFDLKEGQDVDSVLINRLMEQNNISIIVRPKIRENIKTVTLRGAERNAKALFDTRKEILGIQNCACPNDKHVPPHNIQYSSMPQGFQTPTGINDVAAAETVAVMTKLISQNPAWLGLLTNITSSMAQIYPQPMDMTGVASNQFQQSRTNYHGNFQKPCPPDLCSQGEYFGQTLNDMPPFFLPPNQNFKLNTSATSADSDSGYYANSTNSSASSLCNEPHDASDEANKTYRNFKPNDKRSASIGSLITDYEQMKVSATNAMYQDIEEDVRTPTTAWSGYGFSKSVPDFVFKNRNRERKELQQQQMLQQKLEKLSEASSTRSVSDDSASFIEKSHSAGGSSPMMKYSEAIPSPFSMSNCWETVSPVGYSSLSSIKTLPQLFAHFDLHQYTDLFLQQEIDLPSFLSLTDFDLQQMNISYAGRKRMLQVISAMRESSGKIFAQRRFRIAPGAERNFKLTTSNEY